MRKVIYIFLLMQLFSTWVEAAPDSLHIVSMNQKTDTGKVLTYINIASEYEWNAPDSMIANATRALIISEKLNYQKGLFLSFIKLSSARYVTGDFGKGLSEAKSALDIAKANKREDWEMRTYGTLGLLYLQTNKYNEAIECFENRITYYTKIKNDTVLAGAYNNLANCYYFLRDYSKSIAIRQKAIYLRKKLDITSAIGDSYNDLGETYMHMGLSDSAIFYLKQCLEIKQKVHDDEMTSVSSLNLGIEYTNMNQPVIARQYLELSYQMALKIQSKSYQLQVIKAQAKVAGMEKNSKEQAELLNRYIELRDTVYNEENQKQINLMHTEFETEKKELQIKSLETEENQQQMIVEAEKKKNTVIIIFSVIGFILLTSFLLIVANRFRVTKKQNTIIEQQRAVLEEKNKDILDSITYAKRLQDAILPPMSMITKYLPESFVLYQPKDIVAGDFYWMWSETTSRHLSSGDNPEQIVLIAAADCTGHGVPGAMVSVVCSNALNRAVKEFKITEPGKILDKVRELVLETFEKSEDNVQDGMDISLCCINTKTKEVQWSGAYNTLWYFHDGEIIEVPADKQPIGKVDKPVPFNTHNLALQKGDTLYLFTDGYADQFGGPKGKKFKYKQLQELLLSGSTKPVEEQRNILKNTLNAWKGELEQVDDILIIGVRV